MLMFFAISIFYFADLVKIGCFILPMLLCMRGKACFIIKPCKRKRYTQKAYGWVRAWSESPSGGLK